MPVPLLDVNVLVALAWPNHVHHAKAVAWFTAHHHDRWATAPPTEAGFIRVSSNRSVIPDARPPSEAIALLSQLTTLEGHTFWADATRFPDNPHLDPSRLVGHRQVTDAHLVALALQHGGRLVTFDRGISDVVPSGIAPDSVLTILA